MVIPMYLNRNGQAITLNKALLDRGVKTPQQLKPVVLEAKATRLPETRSGKRVQNRHAAVVEIGRVPGHEREAVGDRGGRDQHVGLGACGALGPKAPATHCLPSRAGRVARRPSTSTRARGGCGCGSKGARPRSPI